MRSLTLFALCAAFTLLAGCGKKLDSASEAVAPVAVPGPELPLDPDIAARLELVRRWEWIGFAATDYAAFHDEYPRGIVGPNGRLGLSWRVQLLPYLGRDDLYARFKLAEPWDSAHNKTLLVEMPKVFESPINPAPAGKTHLRAFADSRRLYPNRKPGEPAWGLSVNRISDGTANTLLAIEAAEPVEWTNPADLPFPHTEGKSADPLPKFGGVFDGGFHVLAIDGSVWLQPTNTTPADLRAFITPTGQDKISEAFYNATPKPKPLPKRVPRVLAQIPAELPDASARTAAVENYRTVLRAMHAFAAKNRWSAPAGFRGPNAPGLSWRVQLLPYLGEEELYKQFKLNEPWDSDANKPLIGKMPRVFSTPGNLPNGHTRLESACGLAAERRTPGAGDGMGKAEPLAPGDPLRGNDILPHPNWPGFGSSFALVESRAVPWTKPGWLELPVGNYTNHHLTRPLPELGGVFDGGFHTVHGDGRVTFYKTGYPATHLMRLLAGGRGWPGDPFLDEEKVLYSTTLPEPYRRK